MLDIEVDYKRHFDYHLGDEVGQYISAASMELKQQLKTETEVSWSVKMKSYGKILE